MSKNPKAKDNNFKDKANVCERSKRLKPKHGSREGRTVRELSGRVAIPGFPVAIVAVERKGDWGSDTWVARS
jgi:hypothetical protein